MCFAHTVQVEPHSEQLFFSLVRSTIRALSKNFSIAFLFPAFVTLLFFQHNRTVYDIVAGTIVVKRRGARWRCKWGLLSLWALCRFDHRFLWGSKSSCSAVRFHERTHRLKPFWCRDGCELLDNTWQICDPTFAAFLIKYFSHPLPQIMSVFFCFSEPIVCKPEKCHVFLMSSVGERVLVRDCFGKLIYE